MVDQNDWQTALSTSYEQLISYLTTHIPHFIGAVFLLLLGWLLAWVLSKLTLTALRFIGQMWDKATRSVSSGNPAKLKPSHGLVISKIVFWVVILFFVAAAASTLGLDFFASWLSAFLAYVPQLLASLVILVGGYLLANIAATMAQSTAETAGFAQPSLVGNLTKLAILFTAMVIGIEQLGINIQFITSLFIVASGVLLFGIALAFGLGSKALIANLLGAKQARKHVSLNDHIRIGEIEGTLVDITNTMLVIETASGRIFFPAQCCLDASFHLSVLMNTDIAKTESS
jgi:small-conductance mechanosensitive channel